MTTRAADNEAILFGLTGVGVVETDLATGRLVRANQVFCKMVGYSEDELRGMTYLELTDPEDRARDAESFAALQQGERQTGRSLTRVRHKDGPVVWLELNITLVGEGDRVRNITVATDVTARERTEREARENEERQAFLLKLSDALRPLTDPVAIKGEAARVLAEHLRSDRAYYGEIDHDREIFIVERDYVRGNAPSVVGQHPFAAFGLVIGALREGQDIVTEDTEADPRISAADRSAYAAISTRAFVVAPIVKGGVAISAIAVATVTPRKWTPQEITLVAEVVDRTWAAVERARAEAALRATQERLSLTVESIPDYAIFTTDPEGAVTSWNSGAERVFGYAEADIIGQQVAILFTSKDRAAGVPEQESRAAREQGKANDDRWHLRKDGSRFYISGTVAPLWEGEQLTGYVKIARDLTRERQTEEEREILLEAVQDFNTALEKRVTERTEELARSNMRFTQAFELAPIPAIISTLGKGETFLEVNEAFLNLTGYGRDEVVGKTAFDLSMWSSRGDMKKLVAAQKDGLGFKDLELKLRHKEGGTFDILLSAEVIKIDGHEGYLKMFYDITDRKKTETQMTTAIQSILSEATWFSQEFIARLNHVQAGGTVDTYQPVAGLSLSPRERQLLGYLAVGWSNQKISEEMGLKQQTVRNYISSIYEKLDVHSRAEAVVWAREHGLAGA